MNNRLSHSSVSRFQECPKSYYYWYKEKLRPKVQSAALLFGSAIDHALTVLVKGEEKSPEQVFTYFWRFQEVNGEEVYLPTCPFIVYSNNDLDKDLITSEDFLKVGEKLGFDKVEEGLDEVIKQKKIVGFEGLTQEQKTLLNYCNWYSLYHKGLLMIQAVRKQILPNIVEVLGTQVAVKLENDVGDSVIGFADLVCRWIDGRVIVFDFKTSSREYEANSVLVSPQLTLYVHSLSSQFENTRTAGYIVLNKNINKHKKKVCSKCSFSRTGTRYKTCFNIIDSNRCDSEWIVTIDPTVYIQTIIDDIPPRVEEIIIDNIDDINNAIKQNNFTRNFQSCIKPWGKCAFFDVCYKNDDSNLIKK